MTDKQWLILAKAIKNIADYIDEDIGGFINIYTHCDDWEDGKTEYDITAIAKKLQEVLDGNKSDGT